MKICVTSEGETLDSKIDPRFGRCKYFIIVDTDSLDFEALKNPNTESGGGAGIQSGELMSSKDVKAVLTGNVGPNAFETLNASGIDIFTGISGSIKKAIDKHKSGALKAQKAATVDSHSGISGDKS